MHFSRDQILQLAPDDASAKAGQQLATASKWVLRCVHPQAIWGDCQGSGSSPYKTMVDLANMAFKCSCPSRKFPCKHGLGLMLLFVANPEAFSKQAALAAPVEDWLSKRVARTEAKESKEAKPVDEKAQQKRQEAREKKVESGIEELRLWLKDLVRTGIMGIPQNAYQFSQNITARMVDAQAAGLAARLRKLQKINYHQEGWQKRLLAEIANLYLLTEAYQKNESLPPNWKQELKLLVGWTVPKEEVLAGPAVTDQWCILSRTQEEDDKLQIERIWLYGQETQRFALILNFYAGGQLPEHLMVPGSVMTAEIAFFPSITPLRALIKSQQPARKKIQSIPTTANVADLHTTIAGALAQNPFLEKIPVLLSRVRLSNQNANWFALDGVSEAVVTSNQPFEIWTVLALTRGLEFDCFGTYENEALDIHAVWTEGQFHCIK